MSRSRLAFPLKLTGGRLALARGDEATVQSLKHYLATAPGSHVMARLVGVGLDYNISMESAFSAAFELRGQIALYEPPTVFADVEGLFDEETMTINVNWGDLRLASVRGTE